MEKGLKLGFFVMIILFAGLASSDTTSFFQTSNFGHDANTILISATGDMSLQNASDQNILKNLPKTAQPYTTPIFISGHGADQIWVSVNGIERTLQDSVVIQDGLCGNSSHNYTQSLVFGHYASEIGINVNNTNMTLQEAIDNGYYCNYCTWSLWSACSEACGTGNQTRTDGCGNTQTQSCYIQACGEVCEGSWSPPTYWRCDTQAGFTNIIWEGQYIVNNGPISLCGGTQSYTAAGYYYRYDASSYLGSSGSIYSYYVCRTKL